MTAVERVLALIGGEGSFEAAVGPVLAYQATHNEPLRRFYRSRGLDPDALPPWEEVPPVPVSAFRYAPLVCGPAARVFRTSGTSGGARGEHHLGDVSVYAASWREPFRRALIPDRDALPILSLVPSEDEVPDSSLSFMVSRAAETFGEEVVYGMTRDGLRLADCARALDDAQRRPWLVLATSFALVHLLDALAGRRFHLHAGTRVMETGGLKSRTRAVTRDALHAAVEETLGLPPECIVGEYGMTELCSQAYEPVLTQPGLRRYRFPDWVRTRVLDPVTLKPLPDGDPGLLAFCDLANVGSVASLVTEDVGVKEGEAFELQGRAPRAELRGCSLLTRELVGE